MNKKNKVSSLFNFFEKIFDDSTDKTNWKKEFMKFLLHARTRFNDVLQLTDNLIELVKRDKQLYDILSTSHFNILTMFKIKYEVDLEKMHPRELSKLDKRSLLEDLLSLNKMFMAKQMGDEDMCRKFTDFNLDNFDTSVSVNYNDLLRSRADLHSVFEQ